LTECTDEDITNVVEAYSSKKTLLYNSAVSFIVPRTKFITEDDMKYFKSDLFSLVNIYKFHALHFITQ